MIDSPLPDILTLLPLGTGYARAQAGVSRFSSSRLAAIWDRLPGLDFGQAICTPVSGDPMTGNGLSGR